MRDAEVAELALLRGEEAADSHRGFRLFRDVALRGQTLRLAKPRLAALRASHAAE